jgi:cobalt-zinc-cadmium efflux system outer membrane protein
MKSVSFLFLRIIFVTPFLGQVASGEVLQFTLATFVERAVAKDLGVGQSAYAKDAAEARNTTALAPPDPEVSLSYGTDALGNDEGERVVGLSLSQSIRLPGQKKALREIANAESALANSSRREASRQAAFRAKKLFLHILAARERVNFSRQVSELADELATFVASSAGRGEASGIDAGQTKLKSLAAKEKQAAQEQELSELQAQARTILRAKPEDELVLEGALAFPEQRLVTPDDALSWRTRRPDLVLASREEQAATARLKAKKAARWGIWRLEGFMEHAREIDFPGELEREKSHGIGLAVELPWWGRRQGEEREAKAELGAASLRRDILAESIAIEIRTAVDREKILFQRLSNFRDLLSPLAETNGKDALEAYSQGQISLQQALQVREETLRLKGGYLDLLLEYHLAATTLRASMGE